MRPRPLLVDGVVLYFFRILSYPIFSSQLKADKEGDE